MAAELRGSNSRNNGASSPSVHLLRCSPVRRVSSRIGQTPKPTRQLKGTMNSRQRILSLIVAVATATATGAGLFADDTNTALTGTIDQKIDALDQEIRRSEEHTSE